MPAAHQRRHLRELAGSRRAVGHAEHRLADRAVRHELRDVDADASGLKRRALRARSVGPPPSGLMKTVVMPCASSGTAVCSAPSEPLGRVRVHVDESRRDHQARRIDDPCGRGAVEPADGGDAVCR